MVLLEIFYYIAPWFIDRFLVIINTPNGSAPPLVTGSFGGKYFFDAFYHKFVADRFTGADFIHSLMGEATEYVPLLLAQGGRLNDTWE